MPATFIQKHRMLLLILGPLIIAIVAIIVYFTTGRYISTDNAYIHIGRAEISSNVAGRVIEINVLPNQEVQKGDILFKLDDRDYQNALNEAKAKLENTKSQIASLKSNNKKSEAALFANKAELEAHPLVQQAKAQVDQAELNLSYTIITAPFAGYVSNIEQLQVGDYIKAATPLFGVISKENIWIEANYKETELTHIHCGQKATFTVDTYPGKKFYATVSSISPSTGASISILPPENATGNWVKVVQRVPVYLSIENKLDLNTRLRMGLTVTVSVDTKYTRLERLLLGNSESSESSERSENSGSSENSENSESSKISENSESSKN